jgi:alkylated DNA repair dioxygenase AlkB
VPTLLELRDVRLIPGFITDPERLFETCANGIAWDSRIRARKAASFGLPYNYSGIEWPAAPFPEPLVPVRDAVASTVGFDPNNCLAHYYPSGESTMGFHFDAVNELVTGTGIAVVSLGAERAITFRLDADRSVTERYPLPSGSLLWMSPEMQAAWKHAILGDHAVRGGRVSLTFRQMKT